ncbi:MAG: SLBB domain-containing protein [Bacteroidia bacterium]|nr:SLBB domain-containing protein [Bacteroidia bacterium]
MKKFILIALFFYFVPTTVQSQVLQEDQIQAAQNALAEDDISEDEVRRRLLDRGIDLDNVQPDQLSTLEQEIQDVIDEIKDERGDEELPEEGADGDTELGSVNERVVSSKTQPDTLSTENQGEDQLEKLSRKSADEIRRRMKEGASLDEAIYDQLTKEEQDDYAARTNVYGMDIFFNESLDFYRKTSSSTTPSHYVLDVGDKIAINIFGASQADLIYEIQEDGFIRPSKATKVAKIYLRGVTLGKAKTLLRGRFSQAYLFSKDQFEVSLHTARTITVNIFGEVNAPGSYTISALNTGLNALIAAGGPNEDASLRNIRIMSARTKTIDVYKFMVDPQEQYNFYLRNNDVIYVPKYEKRVSINGGGIRRSATYELKNNETYKDAVKWAGGYSSTLYNGLIQHIYSENGEMRIKDYYQKEIEAQNPKLNDGDRLVFHSSLIEYTNYVNVSGSVRHPGDFELTEGMRVSDALRKAFIEDETYAQIAYLRRKNDDGTFQLKRIYVQKILNNSEIPENFLLTGEDHIILFNKAQFTDNYQFSILGAVRNPGVHFYDPTESITLYDALMLANGPESFATNFGYIVSSPPSNPFKKEYQVVDLETAFKNPSSAKNITLKPNDQIVVPSTVEYMDQHYINVSGAVRSPGEYVFDPSLSFKEVLVMAGGLKMEAASNKIDIFRLKVENNEPTVTYATTIEVDHDLQPLNDNIPFQLKPYDHIVVRTTPDFEPIQYVNITGEVRYPGLYALMEPNERLTSLIERAGGLTDEAFPEAGTLNRSEDDLGLVVTRMDLIQNKKYESKYNLVLKNGDLVNIPKIKEVVAIDRLGTNAEDVYSTNQLEGENLNIIVNYYNRSAKWYINQFAGGFDKTAARKKTTVRWASGRIKKTRSFLFIKFYPRVKRGSEIHLALKDKVLKEQEEKNLEIPKQKKTYLERLTELQVVVGITSAITATTLATITAINGTK